MWSFNISKTYLILEPSKTLLVKAVFCASYQMTLNHTEISSRRDSLYYTRLDRFAYQTLLLPIHCGHLRSYFRTLIASNIYKHIALWHLRSKETTGKYITPTTGRYLIIIPGLCLGLIALTTQVSHIYFGSLYKRPSEFWLWDLNSLIMEWKILCKIWFSKFPKSKMNLLVHTRVPLTYGNIFC